MKKRYIEAPAIKTAHMQMNMMVCGSITKTEGNTGIDIADPTDPVPTTGTSRRRKDIWDDEEEEDDYQ